MGDGGHTEMDSWIQLLIYFIVSLGFVTLQSFYITGRPRKQFELPFQQRIESCLLKRSVKKILYGFICYIYRLKIYMLKRYDMPDLLSKKTPWHTWNVKGFFKQNICRKRHEQSQLRFDRNGPIRTMTNIKNLTRGVGFKGNNFVWNKSNTSNICCARAEVPSKGSMLSLVLREAERRR